MNSIQKPKIQSAMAVLALAVMMILAKPALFPESSAAQAEEEQASWTIMLYLCGSDLESNDGTCSDNLKEVLDADFGDRVNVLVLTGGSSRWDMDGIDPDILEYWHVEDGKLISDRKLEAASMGDPDTLSAFISWGAAACPAEKYGLILWDHGGGSLTGICWDENSDDDNLTLPELTSALDTAGVQLEMIGMDACLMASLETAAAIDGHAAYLVASQESEPGRGWDYRSFLNYLKMNPDSDGAALGRQICESYYEKCRADELNAMATLSVVDLSKIASLEETFQAMTDEMVLLTQDHESLRTLCQSADSAENYGGNSRSEGYTDMIDLYGFTKNAQTVLPDTSQTLLSLLDEAVFYEIHGSQRAGANGLSVIYPLYVDSDVTELFSDISDNLSYQQYMTIIADNWDDSSWTSGYTWTDDDDNEETDSGGNSFLPLPDTFNPVQSSDYDIELSQELSADGYLNLFIESGLDAVSRADFSLMMRDEDSGDYIFLGTDSDVDADWDNGIITDNFQGSWITIGGEYVNANLIEMTDDYNIYTIPAIVNDEETNIRAIYSFDDETYSVLGTYDGVDSTTGASGRDIRPLQEGDEVTFTFQAFTENFEDTERYVSDTITWSDDTEMTDEDLFDGTYLYLLSVYDYFENEYDGDPVEMMVEDGEITAQEIA